MSRMRNAELKATITTRRLYGDPKSNNSKQIKLPRWFQSAEAWKYARDSTNPSTPWSGIADAEIKFPSDEISETFKN